QACPGIFYRNGARVQRVAPAWRRLQTDLGDDCGRKVLRPRLPRGRCSAPARTAAPGPPGLLAARIAPIASGPSTVAISRSRPPPRGQASTSTAIARRISAAHAQWRTADLDASVASEHRLATALPGAPDGTVAVRDAQPDQRQARQGLRELGYVEGK